MKTWVVNIIFILIVASLVWLLFVYKPKSELKKEVPSSPVESYQALPK